MTDAPARTVDTVERATQTPDQTQPWSELGLKQDEYDRIHEILGRRPTSSELAMYSVMWSEHCSYKSSKVHLRKFSDLAQETPRGKTLAGIGENAGVIDVGQGWAVTFKVESHNHPSYVEPYQGAATGVGGIVRDILAMGARPVAVMDSLRFGPLDADDTHRVLPGIVAGVGGYGNRLGLPNIGSEVVFDESYASNPLVNALCVGVLRHEDLHLAHASGTGNKVILYGARTGGDGIGGVSVLASETFVVDEVCEWLWHRCDREFLDEAVNPVGRPAAVERAADRRGGEAEHGCTAARLDVGQIAETRGYGPLERTRRDGRQVGLDHQVVDGVGEKRGERLGPVPTVEQLAGGRGEATRGSESEYDRLGQRCSDNLVAQLGAPRSIPARLCHDIVDALVPGGRDGADYLQRQPAYARRERAEYFRYNQTIHEKIFEAARNSVLLDVYRKLSGRLRRARFAANLSTERWAKAMKEHDEILDALARRDGPRLRTLLQEHLRNKLEVVRQALTEPGSTGSPSAKVRLAAEPVREEP